jgi:hypothetical protein
MKGWKDGRMEGWKDGRMEGWKDGRMEGWKEPYTKEYTTTRPVENPIVIVSKPFLELDLTQTKIMRQIVQERCSSTSKVCTQTWTW